MRTFNLTVELMKFDVHKKLFNILNMSKFTVSEFLPIIIITISKHLQ